MLEHFIAQSMSVLIIELFEVVDVRICNSDRFIANDRVVNGIKEDLFEVAAVVITTRPIDP